MAWGAEQTFNKPFLGDSRAIPPLDQQAQTQARLAKDRFA